MAGGDMSKFDVVFVLGGPGAGKGTQCQMIEKEFGYIHLSAGDLLRAERIIINSRYRDEIGTHIRNGTIVPVEITCSLLRQAMERTQMYKFLIDGFPRNCENLNGWDKVMKEVAIVRKVIFFNCPEQVCMDRCLARGKTSGRTDDNVDCMKKRIETYYQSTMPIVRHYQQQNLVIEINADNTFDLVYADVRKVFQELLQSELIQTK